MAPPKQLVDDNSSSSSASDSEPELAFKVNEAFAEKYEAKKRGEELSKRESDRPQVLIIKALPVLTFARSPPVQDKYGKDYQLGDEDEDDETDYSTDDEDAELVTPEVDAAILRTLAKIRAKDPSVYEEGRAVFDGKGLLSPGVGNLITKSLTSVSGIPESRGRSRDCRRSQGCCIRIQIRSTEGIQARLAQRLSARAVARQRSRGRRGCSPCRKRRGGPDSGRRATAPQARDEGRVPRCRFRQRR